MANPAEQLDVVTFEAHAGPAAEAESAPGELVADRVDRDREARGQALDDHDQGRSVRLPGGEIAQHDPLRLEAAGLPPGTRSDLAAAGHGRAVAT